MTDEQQDREIRRWFKDHQASLRVLEQDDQRLWWLRWKKPRTVIYWIDYVMTEDGRLMVTGDVGTAVYQWCLDSALREDPLAFVADCNLGYFASKCVASAKGREYTQWGEDKAKAALEAWAEENDTEHRRAILHNANVPALDAIGAEAAWNDWLYEFGDEAFGADYPEWSDIGLGVDSCCRTHLVGLTMAMEWLNKEK